MISCFFLSSVAGKRSVLGDGLDFVAMLLTLDLTLDLLDLPCTVQGRRAGEQVCRAEAVQGRDREPAHWGGVACSLMLVMLTGARATG